MKSEKQAHLVDNSPSHSSSAGPREVLMQFTKTPASGFLDVADTSSAQRCNFSKPSVAAFSSSRALPSIVLICVRRWRKSKPRAKQKQHRCDRTAKNQVSCTVTYLGQHSWTITSQKFKSHHQPFHYAPQHVSPLFE